MIGTGEGGLEHGIPDVGRAGSHVDVVTGLDVAVDHEHVRERTEGAPKVTLDAKNQRVRGGRRRRQTPGAATLHPCSMYGSSSDNQDGSHKGGHGQGTSEAFRGDFHR